MDATVIRVSEPREILAAVVYGLGFRPAESLVALSLRGDPGRLGLVARADLADLSTAGRAEGDGAADGRHHASGEPGGRALARALAGHLVADGARQVMLVVYSDAAREAVRDGQGVAGAALATMRRAFAPGVVADVWHVGPHGYAGVDCEDEGCCPAGGRPLAELETTQVGTAMVVAGATVAERREDLGVRWRAPAPARRAASRGAASERARRRDARADAARSGRADALLDVADGSMTLWSDLRRRARERAALPPAGLGRLLVALEDLPLRDAMLLTLVSVGHDDAPASVAERLAAVFAAGGRPPEEDVVGPARAVLEACVAHAPSTRRAAPLAMLAWLAWWEGDGARAAVLVDECLSIKPEHGLGTLVDRSLRQGLGPGWTRPGG